MSLANFITSAVTFVAIVIALDILLPNRPKRVKSKRKPTRKEQQKAARQLRALKGIGRGGRQEHGRARTDTDRGGLAQRRREKNFTNNQ